MAKFKQVPQAYLFNKLMGFWGNMVKNYRSDVQDDDFFDELFLSLWNHEKGREKCRVILQSIKDYMVADNLKTKDETMEKRFMELKRVLKLSDLEFDVLMIAYVRSQTCFSWPCRVEDRDKTAKIGFAA